MEITKEIEEKFAKGNVIEVDGISYVITGMCKYYKKWIDGVCKQFDIALYLHKQDDPSVFNIICTNLE